MTEASNQKDVLAFLRSEAAWPAGAGPVSTVETHGAIVFLAGADALKVKRAVKLPYLDFSTLEQRRHFCRREIEINGRFAPEIYRGLVAITREADGRLTIEGQGEPVDYAVRMARFDERDLLSEVVRGGRMTHKLAQDLADAVSEAHAGAKITLRSEDPGPSLVERIAAALETCEDALVKDAAQQFRRLTVAALHRSEAIRLERARSGHVRRCHGDLHLGNIVLWRGKPTLFDAIEFDEDIATIDTLDDLAFLLMDLDRKGARSAANVVLNRYVWRSGDISDLHGLRALPLFLGVRAAIRAMVALDRARTAHGDQAAAIPSVLKSLAQADRDLAPPEPCLIAIGGFSGTGKSLLAAALAPDLGASPGAIVLRTDLERKWLAKVEPEVRLPRESYTSRSAEAVYQRLKDRGRAALAAGHSVIMDAVFDHVANRDEVEAIARDVGCRFHGFWLEAAPDVLRKRVADRRRDASDATPEVVDLQLRRDPGPIRWVRLDAGQESAIVAEEARRRMPLASSKIIGA